MTPWLNAIRQLDAPPITAHISCAHCRKRFIPSHPQAKCCSTVCSEEYKRDAAKRRKQKYMEAQATFEHKCVVCGQGFISNHNTRKTCSPECGKTRARTMKNEARRKRNAI